MEPGYHCAQVKVQGKGNTKRLSYLFMTRIEAGAQPQVLGTSVTL